MKIALTIDDGPNPGTPGLTPQFVELLGKYGVTATFFCIGVNVDALPDVVKQTAEAGHLIGNHSYTHPDLTTISEDAVREELSKTNIAIQNATGQTPTYFRPPTGATNDMVNTVASQLGLQGPILWTVDTNDWRGVGVDAVVSTLLSAGDGAIILCHDGVATSDQTLQALDRALPQMQQNGAEFVTIDQMGASEVGASEGLLMRPSSDILIPHPSKPLLAPLPLLR